jgi:hypothetical protein
MTNRDDEAAAYHGDPEHLRPAGPWVTRRVRPGVKNLQYVPPECGPQTWTVSTGTLPHWERNPEA